MFSIEGYGDPETKQVQRLEIQFVKGEGSGTGDLEFLTKLANALTRGACIIIDPGLATEFVYEAGERVEEEESEGDDG